MTLKSTLYSVIYQIQDDLRRHSGQQVPVPIYHQERTPHAREVGHPQQLDDLQEVPQQVPHHAAITGDPIKQALKRLRSLLTAKHTMKKERQRKYKNTSKTQELSSGSKRQSAKKRYKGTVGERMAGSEKLPWVS